MRDGENKHSDGGKRVLKECRRHHMHAECKRHHGFWSSFIGMCIRRNYMTDLRRNASHGHIPST